MSEIGGKYISDGAIMAWLAQQQDRIYTDLEDSMDMSERRADFQSALTNIKTQLGQANDNHDFSAVGEALQSLMSEFGDDPVFEQTCAQLQSMAAQITGDLEYKTHIYPEKQARYDAAVGESLNSLSTFGGRGGSSPTNIGLGYGSIKVEKPATPVDSYSGDTLKSWDNLIGGQIDNAGRNDQLTMIHIQELKATLDQGSQLASSFISSGDKTTSSIINNIA